MKKNGIIVLIALLFAGCSGMPSSLSLKDNLNRAIKGNVKEIAAKSPLKSSAGLAVNEENIVNAVQSHDLAVLQDLLENVDDVRTVVSDDVLLLHLAEEAMGEGGVENPVTRLLVEKNAWILQRNGNGENFARVISNLGMDATPRQDYALELIGDKFDRYIKALRADSVADIKPFAAWMPKNGRFLYDAVHEKAAAVTAWLIEEGVAVESLPTSGGDSALHLVCDNYPYDYAFDRRTELVRVLLKTGADINARNQKGETPLAKLLYSESIDNQDKMGSPAKLADVLLKNGASVTEVDSQGFSMVYLAVNSRSPETLTLILETGVPIDEKVYAANYLNASTMKILLKYGADLSIIAGKVNGAMESAEQRTMIEMLLSAGASVQDFNLQQLYSNFENVRILVDKGADLSASNILLNALLNYVDMERIEYLVAHGADINRKYLRGKRFLHYIVKERRLEAARFCIEQGVDVNPLDDDGKTPLDYCSERQVELREYLISHGAKLARQL